MGILKNTRRAPTVEGVMASLKKTMEKLDLVATVQYEAANKAMSERDEAEHRLRDAEKEAERATRVRAKLQNLLD